MRLRSRHISLCPAGERVGARATSLIVATLLFLSCGALTPPRPDGGTDAGSLGGGTAVGGGGGATGGGNGGGNGGGGGTTEAPWVEVALQVPAGTLGSVQRLSARPGEIYALVSNQYVLRSVGGRFDEVRVYAMPVVDHMQFSGSGAVALLVFNRLASCVTGCEQAGTWDDFNLPFVALGLCGSADFLGVMTRSPDAGVALYEQTATAWDPVNQLNLRSPLDCARTTRGDFFIAGTGAIGTANPTTTALEVPDTTALGRVSANEPWSKVSTDGTSVIAASARGAVARRPQDAGWSVASALSGEISALAVESASEIWVAGTGLGLARFDGTQWNPAGAGPPLLTRFESIALESSHVYVGGSDAAGVARVFRRLR
jgi:hypothetical protein